MEIRNFLDCQEHLHTVASWLIEEFFSDKPEHTVDSMHKLMKGARRDALPLGLIAFEGEEPIGVVNLLKEELDRPSHYFPWLAGLFVHPKHRGKKIGDALISSCLQEAAKQGYSALHLFTDIPSFYERLGWVQISKVEEEPRLVVMRHLLSN